jgi:hypothetical protein
MEFAIILKFCTVVLSFALIIAIALFVGEIAKIQPFASVATYLTVFCLTCIAVKINVQKDEG